MSKMLKLAAAAALLAASATVAMAQAQNPSGAQNPTGDPRPVTPGGADNPTLSLPQVTEARRTAFEAEEVRSLSREPHTMSDKLFVLREYRPALREVALAELVIDRVRDPDVSALAITVRDGHRLGAERLRSIAADLDLPLPADISEIEKAEIEALRSLPPQDLALFFLVRQRAMHAWDVTVFTDYEHLARNDRLRRYIAETIPPLRRHAAEVDALARVKGIPSKVVTAAPR